MYMEAGAMSQNIHLACTAMGIGSVDYAGYLDAQIDESLALDGLYESVIHLCIVGTI